MRNNRAYVLLSTLWALVESAFSSASLLLRSVFSGKRPSPIAANRFFEAVHFALVSGPKRYWSKPTGIAAGRSVGTFLHFVLEKDLRFKERKKGGFTLVETMVAITVISIILVYAFDSLGQILFFRTKVSDRIDLGQDLHYTIERLAETVKEGGEVDYEEYFNRAVVGTGMSQGHYSALSGFGNYGSGGTVGGLSFGDGTYLCRSGNGIAMGTGGCFGNAFNDVGASHLGKPQRYGQYALQFTDYNANQDSDLGNEDGIGSIVGDDDDENLGEGPSALVFGQAVPELYLVKNSGDLPERLILRRNVVRDPDAPATLPCDLTNGTGSGCIGRLEMLRLVGRDYGLAHTGVTSVASPGRFDGVVDTWECRSDFKCLGRNNTPTGSGSEWVSVFPDDINVASLNFYPYPNKDHRLAWKEDVPANRVAPYVRIELSVGFSWKRRKKMSNQDSRAAVTTTISLTQ